MKPMPALPTDLDDLAACEISQTVMVDAGYLEAMLAAAPPLEAPPGPRPLGPGAMAGAAYMARVVAAAERERQLRLGTRCP